MFMTILPSTMRALQRSAAAMRTRRRIAARAGLPVVGGEAYALVFDDHASDVWQGGGELGVPEGG